MAFRLFHLRQGLGDGGGKLPCQGWVVEVMMLFKCFIFLGLFLDIIDQSIKTLRKSRHEIRIMLIVAIQERRMQIGLTGGIETPEFAMVTFCRRRRKDIGAYR